MLPSLSRAPLRRILEYSHAEPPTQLAWLNHQQTWLWKVRIKLDELSLFELILYCVPLSSILQALQSLPKLLLVWCSLLYFCLLSSFLSYNHIVRMWADWTHSVITCLRHNYLYQLAKAIGGFYRIEPLRLKFCLHSFISSTIIF